LSRTIPTRENRSEWARVLVLIAGFWSIAFLQSVAWRYYVTRPRPEPLTLEFIATLETIMFGIAACLSPAVVYLVRRFPLERGHWSGFAATHLISGACFALLVKFLWDLAIYPWYPTPWLSQGFQPGLLQRSLFDGFQVNVLLYVIFVAGLTSADHAERSRRANLEATTLRAQLAEARLESLRRQLDPHFLFNTLHSIAAMLHTDPGGAGDMIAQLSDLLRRSLDQRVRHVVPLSEEIAFVTLYLDIQKRRLEDRLQVQYEIDEEAVEALVPDMILQPLVENSIRHAITPRLNGGSLTIRARAHRGTLQLEVEDAVGQPACLDGKEGIGIRSIRERLRSMYGDRGALEYVPSCNGLLARVMLPLSEEKSDGVRTAANHFGG
jgi:two-component sensor histidine kinase